MGTVWHAFPPASGLGFFSTGSVYRLAEPQVPPLASSASLLSVFQWPHRPLAREQEQPSWGPLPALFSPPSQTTLPTLKYKKNRTTSCHHQRDGNGDIIRHKSPPKERLHYIFMCIMVFLSSRCWQYASSSFTTRLYGYIYFLTLQILFLVYLCPALWEPS